MKTITNKMIFDTVTHNAIFKILRSHHMALLREKMGAHAPYYKAPKALAKAKC